MEEGKREFVENTRVSRMFAADFDALLAFIAQKLAICMLGAKTRRNYKWLLNISFLCFVTDGSEEREEGIKGK